MTRISLRILPNPFQVRYDYSFYSCGISSTVGNQRQFRPLPGHARKLGTGFDDPCRIGRHGLAIPVSQLQKIVRTSDAKEPKRTELEFDGFADDISQTILGACSVPSVDYFL